MKDSKIIIAGKEFPLSFKLLEKIAANLAGDENSNEIAKAILDLGVPSLTEDLIEGNSLSSEDIDRLWATGELNVRRLLANHPGLWLSLSNQQAKEILDLDDPVILAGMCEWAEILTGQDSDEEENPRLSESMVEALFEHVSSHENPHVRQALLDNPLAPEEFLPKFRDFVKTGVYPEDSDILISLIEPEDVPTLARAPLKLLKEIAARIEEIEDKTARKEAANFLAAHPDMGVRLELAENPEAPKAALKHLAKDAEAEVAAAARESLEE